MPTPTWSGYTFDGWFTAASGGARVTASTVVTGNVTYYAHWTKNVVPPPEPVDVPELYDEVTGEAPNTAASEYNGLLVDADGVMAGTIQVKIGAPSKKTGIATASASVQIGSGKKKSLKVADKGKVVIESYGPTEIEFKGGDECVVLVGSDGMSGYYGKYEITGSRNLLSSKDKAEAKEAASVIAQWVGSLAVVWDGGSATVAIDKKGKAKVSIVLSSGAKGSVTSQLLIGEEWLCVPVIEPKKTRVAFTLWLPDDGDEPLVDGLGDDVLVGRTGALDSGSSFSLDIDDPLWDKVSPDVLTEYLPDGVSVTQKGSKWTLPKAGKISVKKGVLDDSKAGENPSGLKLSLKKDGSFTGSFKVYYIEKGKLKNKTANVTGLVLNGAGFGTATIKGIGSIAITID